MNPGENLQRLLTVWQACKDPRLADAIATYSRSRESETAARWRKTPPKQEDWLKLADTVDPIDRGALLESLEADSSKRVRARIITLASWPPDPRTVDALHRVIHAQTWISQGARPVWTQLFKLLQTLADVRSITVAEESVDSDPYMQGKLTKVAAAIASKNPRPVTESELSRSREIVASIPAAASCASAESLLEAVLANPDDDAARLILADAMQEQKDPQGTLIVLQFQKLQEPLTRVQKALEKKLLKENMAEWMGPLHPVTLVRGREFERGFLSACEFKEHPREHLVDAAMGHPLLATIRSFVGPLEFALQPEMRSLRTFRCEGAGDYKQLFRADRALLIETLQMSLGAYQADLLDSVRCLPNLTKLSIRPHGGLSLPIVLQSDLGRQVDVLAVQRANLADVVGGLATLSSAPPTQVSVSWDGDYNNQLYLDANFERKPKASILFEVHSSASLYQGDPMFRAPERFLARLTNIV